MVGVTYWQAISGMSDISYLHSFKSYSMYRRQVGITYKIIPYVICGGVSHRKRLK